MKIVIIISFIKIITNKKMFYKLKKYIDVHSEFFYENLSRNKSPHIIKYLENNLDKVVWWNSIKNKYFTRNLKMRQNILNNYIIQ